MVVAGDLNDTPNRAPLQPLLSKEKLHDVLKLQFPNEPEKRWTYHYEANEQIDCILVSKKLKERFLETDVERRGIPEVDNYSDGEVRPYSSLTSWLNAASGLDAVWALFD